MKPDLYEFSVAVIGNYSPSIIQPYWLVHKGLVQEADAEAAELEINHPEITKFKFDWAAIEVTRNKLLIRTTVESKYEVMIDLIIGIHRILRESNANGLGINHIFHKEISEEEGNKIRDVFTPSNAWEGVMDSPKLLGMEMMEYQKNEFKKGSYRIRIASSELMKGVSFNINDHYDISDESKNPTLDAMDCLLNRWKESMDDGRNKIETLWNKVF